MTCPELRSGDWMLLLEPVLVSQGWRAIREELGRTVDQVMLVEM